MNVFINEDVARDYDSFYTTEPGISIDRLEKEALIRIMDKLPRQSMLEVGCGTGHWSEFFAGLGFSVRAADISDAMLGYAKRKDLKNVEFEKADVLALPYPDNSFGIVASITMLEFTGNIPLALKEMSRVLKPGGWLLLGCINAGSMIGKTKENDPVFRDARFLTRTELHELLSDIGEPQIMQCVHLSDSFELLDGTDKQDTAEGAFMVALVRKTMDITVEISYYALAENYAKPVDEFLGLMESQAGVTLSPGVMSTLITGDFDVVMNLLSASIKPMMEKYPSVFTLKIANACKECRV